jgi:integrase
MPTRSLTVASVARVKPPKQGQDDYYDRGYPGFALRVSYGGSKTWIYFYRLHGKLRRMSLGRFPGMTLDEARGAWRAARLAVSKGESPAHIKPTTADTFAATYQEWLKRDQVKNRSVAQVQQALEYNAVPAWGDRLVAGITRRDVLELIDGVVDRGALTMARRLHSHLHRLFRWAVGRGILDVNPMADLPKPGKAIKRDRVLSDGELKAVWKAAEKTAWPFGPAIRLLILAAARREEIGALRWSEIHGDEIRIPGERSKSGELRIIPLSSTALALIQDLPRAGEYVFSANGSGLGGWSKAKRAIDAAAAEMNGGPLSPWRLHDIRRTVATGLQRLGVGLQVVESILGHVSGSRAGVVGVYQRHQFPAEKRQALEAWAGEVVRITADGKIESLHQVRSNLPAVTSLPKQDQGSSRDPAVPMAHEAGVRFAGSGSLRAAVHPIDMQWVVAIGQADKSIGPDPLLTYLRKQPEPQLGPAECWLLCQLLERMRFKRKKRGNFVQLGMKSKEQINETGAAYVRELQRSKGLTREEAIDLTWKTMPELFGHDAGASLANSMKRGSKSR